MPAWTPMNDLSTGDLVTEADMDAIRGNIAYLLNPNHARLLHSAGSAYSTTSLTFVDVDNANLSITLTTNGGPVLVLFSGVVYANTSAIAGYLDVAVDGVRASGAAGGLVQMWRLGPGAASAEAVSFPLLVTGLSAGTHTFTLQWAVQSGGVLSLLSDTANNVVQFAAIEL